MVLCQTGLQWSDTLEFKTTLSTCRSKVHTLWYTNHPLMIKMW